MRTMKDSGIEWIGVMPKSWVLAPLKAMLIEIKEQNDPIQTTQVLSLTNQAKIFPYEERGNQGNKSKEKYEDYKIAYPNTIVLNSMNVLIGSVGICNYFGCVSPVYYVFNNSNNAILRYINYIFQNVGFQKELRKYANGIMEIRLRVSVYDILHRLVPAPSLKEQQRIADFLDSKCVDIDNILEKTKASIEEYKKLKQSVITEAVTKGVRGTRPMKDSGIEWIGLYPADWTLTKIKWLLNERNERSEDGSEEPLSMSQKYGLIPTKEMDTIPNMASSFVGAKITHVGDLVFNKLKAHLGVFAVSKYEGLVSPDYAVYYKTARADMRYLEHLFKTPQYILEFRKRSSGVGAGLTRLYTSDLFAMYSASPSLEEQQEIAAYLDKKCSEIDSLISSKEKFITELESYKKSLIYEYVTGKKEVPAEA